MSKDKFGNLIHNALREALKNQEELLEHKRAAELLPIILQLARFISELEDWYSGNKYHLNNLSRSFLAKAKKLKTEADDASKRIWEYAPVNFVPFVQRMCDCEKQSAMDKSYPEKIRSQFNNLRLGLLEQFAGARLLDNNNDLGEEVERLVVQYLERRIGNSVRVLRGGNICDHAGNRDDQTDIIITPANALGFCPADTGNGKYDVMIDQVIAAISVTSRLTAKTLRQKWQQLQKIPTFNQKKDHVADHAWPLCYIISAESDDLDKLEAEWEKLTSSGDVRHNPQMLLPLDSGYIVARNACWPSSKLCRGPKSALNQGYGINAGLGLAWLETQISGRNCLLTRSRYDWVERLSEQLSRLELRELPPLPANFEAFIGHQTHPIHGILSWGRNGMPIHNQLHLITICLGHSPKTTLLTTKPISTNFRANRHTFEPRWFKMGVVAKNGDYCAFEEWTDAKDCKNHQRHIVVFDSRTGEEITNKLTRPLKECPELEQLNPVF